jgi:hypothetical protein
MHHGGNLSILWNLMFCRLLSSGLWCHVVWYNSTMFQRNLLPPYGQQMKIKGSSTNMVCLYQTTLRYSPQHSSPSSSSVWSHHVPRHPCVQATTISSFFITWYGILSLLSVNKKYILFMQPTAQSLISLSYSTLLSCKLWYPTHSTVPAVKQTVAISGLPDLMVPQGVQCTNNFTGHDRFISVFASICWYWLTDMHCLFR